MGWGAGFRARCVRALALLALTLALVPGLAGTAEARAFREPGLLPGGPEETPFTLADMALLRSRPAPPAIGARAAIVWDATAGSELFAKAPDERIPPASTTKMLTALISLELLPLDTRLTVDTRDITLQEYDESSMNLAAGDTLTFEDLLYGMLLVSGGDAARTVARAAGTTLLAGATGDPLVRFVQEMNDRAARLGLANSHFTNPQGDDAPGHYSSARDLLRLADEALKRPDFTRIVATRETARTTVDGRRSFPLENSNTLLGTRAGIHGVKTGTTDKCGKCLVAAQWGPGGRILTVVLGSTDRFADTVALLDWTNAAYRWATLGQGSTLPGLNSSLARWGVGFRSQKPVVMHAWEAPSLRYRLLLEPGTGTAGEARGQVVFLAGVRELGRVPVYGGVGSR